MKAVSPQLQGTVASIPNQMGGALAEIWGSQAPLGREPRAPDWEGICLSEFAARHAQEGVGPGLAVTAAEVAVGGGG